MIRLIMTQPLQYAVPKDYATVTQDQFDVFHAHGAISGWKGERVYRVYVQDGKLFFIKVGAGRQQLNTGYAVGGLIGVAIAAWMQKRDKKKQEKMLADIYSVPPEQLLPADKANVVYELSQLTDVSIEPASMWSSAKCGRFVFRDPKGKKRRMTFDDPASAMSGQKHLSAALGDGLKVNAIWNDQKQKFVKTPKA